MTHTTQGFILTLQCPDRIGIVSGVSGLLAERGLSIEEADQFHDHMDGRFYMRTAFAPQDGAPGPSMAELEAAFAPIAQRFSMDWQLYDAARPPRVVVAVSRFGHCLHDLLHRWKTGWLRADIAGVVSNHEDMRGIVEWNGLPYLHRPVAPDTKAAAEAEFLKLMDDTGAELLVLARYMQVLSPETARRLEGRCINIHHSFLPGFKGAKPYHQAHARGVKIIGATAHYVTEDLDEGPIIEQSVQRVSHRDAPADLVDIGRDAECQTLARAVRWHAERRVLRAGRRTIVFA